MHPDADFKRGTRAEHPAGGDAALLAGLEANPPAVTEKGGIIKKIIITMKEIGEKKRVKIKSGFSWRKIWLQNEIRH